MKQTFLFTLLLLQCFWGFAQAPNKMSYQAVIRNSNNTVVSNHAVGMRISILQGTAIGSSVYTETQSPTTNANGLIAIEIGTGTILSGSFANIDWANGPYFVKTETDPNGGSNYTLTGTSQLLSVPYAMYAKNSSKTDTASVAKVALNGIPSGAQHGQSLTMCDGELIWATGGLCPAKIIAFNCADTIHNGIITANFPAENCNSSISYIGGNGGVYAAQIIPSTGVTGLKASIQAGSLNSGNGILKFNITGTPQTSGTASFIIKIGNLTCILNRSVIVASISNFNCSDTIHSGPFVLNYPISYLQSTISYSGGNGANYISQIITSSGVSGITAKIVSGTLNNGEGLLTISYSGTPISAGIAQFNIWVGNKNCIIYRTVYASPPYPVGSIFCNSTPTLVLDVTNPITGKTWMDRNLGATRAATSSTDTLAFGDLYQWGRGADGHQCRNSSTTTTLSTTDQPGNGQFILGDLNSNNWNWRSTLNVNLWQGINGINNPCPYGYRIPSNWELENERLSWSINQSNNFIIPIKLTLAGHKQFSSGNISGLGFIGNYWGNLNYGNSSSIQRFFDDGRTSQWDEDSPGNGNSVRCIKD
jgi:hypothetical protein